MTVYYVDSAAGSNTSPYDTWAKAATTLAAVDALDAAGDTIYVASTHNESIASSTIWSWAGSVGSPTKIIVADKTSGAPPATIATGGAVSCSASANMDWRGDVYTYGLTFNIGIGASSNTFQDNIANQQHFFEKCVFNVVATAGLIKPQTGFSGTSRIVWKDCDVKFANASGQIVSSADFRWSGGSILAGSTAPTTLFACGNTGLGGPTLVENVDLSNGGSSMNIFSSTGNGLMLIRDCKLPASWSGSLFTGTIQPGCRAEMHNCDSGDTNYRLAVADYNGTIVSNDVIGTTDVTGSSKFNGATELSRFSWKMDSGSGALYPMRSLATPDILVWNDAVGSSKTFSIEYVADTNVAAGQGAGTASAFQNNEVWVELAYLGTSGFPLGSRVESRPANILTTPTDNSAGGTWTTTGLTTPKTGKLSVTFTPQEKGYVIARVCIGKASKTIYVDPNSATIA